MILIAGLGNPDLKYAATRHNVGFEAIACLLQAYHGKGEKRKFHALLAQADIEGTPCLLCRPQTYMNNSGVAVREIMDFYKISVSDLIVIYDDISFSPGNLRFRESGSAGGHNGVKSIIKCLNTQRFMRIKVGVGEKPKDWDLADFVLGRFTKEEREHLEGAMERAAEAVCYMVNGEVAKAMNEYNKKVTD